MIKKQYIIDYENAHWCGGQSHVVVWAESADDAVIIASDHMEDEMRELFHTEYAEQAEEYEEECPYEDESAVAINSVELLNSENEHWEFYNKPSQSQFYPVVGEP